MCLAWRRARFTPVPALGPSWRKVEDSRRDTKPRLMRIFIRSDRKSTRLNSSHLVISYAVFCLKKKKKSWDRGTSSLTHGHSESSHSGSGELRTWRPARATTVLRRITAQHATVDSALLTWFAAA